MKAEGDYKGFLPFISFRESLIKEGYYVGRLEREIELMREYIETYQDKERLLVDIGRCSGLTREYKSLRELIQDYIE